VADHGQTDSALFTGLPALQGTDQPGAIPGGITIQLQVFRIETDSRRISTVYAQLPRLLRKIGDLDAGDTLLAVLVQPGNAVRCFCQVHPMPDRRCGRCHHKQT